jgi:hypothetical protein
MTIQFLKKYLTQANNFSTLAVYEYATKKRSKYQHTLEEIAEFGRDEKFYLKEHMIMLPQRISFTKYFIGKEQEPNLRLRGLASKLEPRLSVLLPGRMSLNYA